MIVNEAGEEVARGEIGELWMRGPSSSAGYYEDPESTWQVWTKEGWFKTGDLARLDQYGNFQVVGRKKDMIRRGAQNIYPIEVEKILLTHPKVAAVSIVGMPDTVMGEKACAYVVPKPGKEFTFDEMISFIQEKRIAKFKLPERLEIVDELPMARGEKVNKSLLREDIEQKLKKEGVI